MVVSPGALQTLGLLGVVAGVTAFAYFLFRGLRRDHETGEYHFTWGVGVVVLFLMGFAPGLVGLGLYLTVQRGYPVYWLVACLAAVVLVLAATGLALDTEAVASAADLAAVARY